MANDECANSSSETKFSYDVFLSFRGEDTRHGFTATLYKALCNAGFNTFMDNYELKVGSEIGPALGTGIEESKMAIVVFSENYAESSWCLDEFAQIMECHSRKNQMVIPIFYNVEPSHVRHQGGCYHQSDESRVDSNRIAKWKSSLDEGTNLKGFHFNGQGYENEHKMIEEIVSEASLILSPRTLDINENIVGLNDPVEELKSKLEIESKVTTCFLGIHGTGGIGKTTLAKVLYNSICNQFEGSCFLSNVRESSKQYEGLKHTLERFLTDMLREGTIHLTSVDEGIKTIQQKLGKKRVLLVLDGVDDIKQLDELAGGRDWFGSGSRIIITTRDKHLLDLHEVEKIHEMKVLNGHHSMELFCQNAFKLNYPATNYEEISNRAVRFSKGLPLALKVLGSHLFGKNMRQWKSALDKYEKFPPSYSKYSYNKL